MPLVSFTIEDNSPILKYSDQWSAGNSQDNQADKYSLSSFTLCNTQGSSMMFTYYGNDVQIYGAKRQNHGNYRVVIDNGNVSFSGNGVLPGDGSFQEPLFSPSTPLAKGQHTVTLTNQENKFLDVDFLTWQSPVGEDGEQLLMNTYDDTHQAFSYFPSSSWTTNPPNQGRFFGATGHTTSDPNAHMEFIFEVSDAVTLHGPVDPAGSAYTVQLDGGPAQSFTTNKPSPQAQMMMYQAFQLGPGMHNLTMRYAPSSVNYNKGQQFLAIDYATVYTTPSVQKASIARTAVSGGTIAGLVIGNIILLLIIILGSICLYRYKKYGYMNWRFLTRFKHKRMSDVFKEELQLPRPFDVSVQPTPNLQVQVGSRWISGKRRLLRMPSWRWPMSESQQSSNSAGRYRDSYDPPSLAPVPVASRAVRHVQRTYQVQNPSLGRTSEVQEMTEPTASRTSPQGNVPPTPPPPEYTQDITARNERRGQEANDNEKAAPG